MILKHGTVLLLMKMLNVAVLVVVFLIYAFLSWLFLLSALAILSLGSSPSEGVNFLDYVLAGIYLAFPIAVLCSLGLTLRSIHKDDSKAVRYALLPAATLVLIIILSAMFEDFTEDDDGPTVQDYVCADHTYLSVDASGEVMHTVHSRGAVRSSRVGTVRGNSFQVDQYANNRELYRGEFMQECFNGSGEAFTDVY